MPTDLPWLRKAAKHFENQVVKYMAFLNDVSFRQK
jgi:hypothetical protein